MTKAAHFRVDPRLASLLGESYRSTEQAIKELIDNAWDADAENVWITLPEPMDDAPIVVKDDGTGMTEKEVRSEYLNIASDRRTRKGEKTHRKGRQVKGRKGIGKFAGLAAAETMNLITMAMGTVTSLQIVKQALLDARKDLERIGLLVTAQSCDKPEHGTTVTLSELNQKLAFPTPEALKELLVLEYGRQPDFTLHVNDEPLAQEDIPGRQFEAEVELPDAGSVRIRFTIMDEPTAKKHAGIVMRVGGKVVGRPSFIGLDDREEIPPKLLRRVVGEIVADSLEEDVTADWGAIIENSKGFAEARQWAEETVASRMASVLSSEVNLAKARRQKQINNRLAGLPEHRRHFANTQVERVLKKLYGEREDRIDVVVSVMLDAMEKDEYWSVVQNIESARQADVSTFAEALDAFGLVDMAVMTQQATRRLALLDALDNLAANKKTLEKQMHTALASNLWVFGPEYSLLSSDKTLARVIAQYTGDKFKGKRAANRPDLLLSKSLSGRLLLIEFKRPAASVGRDAESQAKEYRDDLTPSHGAMDMLIVGGSVDSSMSDHYACEDTKFLSYDAVISTARTQLNWLLKELTTEGGFQG